MGHLAHQVNRGLWVKTATVAVLPKGPLGLMGEIRHRGGFGTFDGAAANACFSCQFGRRGGPWFTWSAIWQTRFSEPPALVPAQPRLHAMWPPARLGVSLAGLIAADIITPPFNLHRTYKGVELTARVESDGTVTFQGESFKSLSTAGGVARLSAGWRSTPTRKIPQTNGWSFWQFTDADGQEKPIDALRQRFLAERESAES